MKRLAIIGSGDLGKQIAYHALTDGHYQPIGFFDDYQQAGTNKHGLPILGKTSSVINHYQQDGFDVVMIGIGYLHHKQRAEFYENLVGIIPFGSIVHSSSYVDPSCQLGSGIFIYPGCTLDAGVCIEDNVLINAGCTIAHDTVIGKNSFLSPGVSVAGFVKIDQSVTLGIGTIVIDNVKIVKLARTGAGTVVVQNLDQAGLYVGVPARFKK